MKLQKNKKLISSIGWNKDYGESKIADIPGLQWSSMDDLKRLSQMDPSFVVENIESFKDAKEL